MMNVVGDVHNVISQSDFTTVCAVCFPLRIPLSFSMISHVRLVSGDICGYGSSLLVNEPSLEPVEVSLEPLQKQNGACLIRALEAGIWSTLVDDVDDVNIWDILG